VVRVDQHRSVKLLSAVISAVVVMGEVAVSFANEQAGTDTVRSAPETAVTTTTPPTEPITSVATPETTASTPAGYR
jgi:Na+-transporting methylmalonyl-CoA/oxaloacetate decarboxylase gamma subunit